MPIPGTLSAETVFNSMIQEFALLFLLLHSTYFPLIGTQMISSGLIVVRNSVVLLFVPLKVPRSALP
jgi:hypothetical protein